MSQRATLLRAIEDLNRENPRKTWSWKDLAARLGVTTVEVVAMSFALQAKGDIEDFLVLKRVEPPLFTRREIDQATRTPGSSVESATVCTGANP